MTRGTPSSVDKNSGKQVPKAGGWSAAQIRPCSRLFIGLALLLLPFAKPCFADDNSTIARAASIVKSDFENFYLARGNLIPLGICLFAFFTSGAGMVPRLPELLRCAEDGCPAPGPDPFRFYPDPGWSGDHIPDGFVNGAAVGRMQVQHRSATGSSS